MIVRFSIIAIFLGLLWQCLVVIAHLPPYVLPGPGLVLQSLMVNAALIGSNLIPTLSEIVIGLALSIVCGVCLGLLLALVATLRYWLLPIVLVSQAIPIFALAPLLVLWFGYGMFSKIITIVLMLSFPIASAFYDGLSRVNQEWLDMAKSMHGQKFWTLWYIGFPGALPSLAAGIRVAAVLAPMGAIISEWVGASQGLGFLMLNANARLDIPLVFACLIAIVGVSLLLYVIINGLLRTLIYW